MSTFETQPCRARIPVSRQSGAISVLAASALSLSLVMVALAVDSARLFYQHSEVQGAADAAAVAAITEYARDDTSGESPMAAAQQAAETTVQESLGERGELTDAAVGRMRSEDGELTFQPDGSGLAMQVGVERPTPASLVAGWVWPEEAVLAADAVAEQPQIIELQAASGLASLETGNSEILNALFGGLLGTDLSLDLATYQGLADTNIELADLVEAHAGASSVEELLDTRLTLAELVDLTARAAPGQTSAVLQLGALAARVDPMLDLRLGDVLAIGLPSEEMAANVALNALSLVRLGAQAANEGQAVALDLSSDVLSEVGAADLNVDLELGEPPEIAIGEAGKAPNGEWRTEVNTGQLGLAIELEALSALSSVLEITADIQVDLAQGSARARDLRFENGSPVVEVGAEAGASDLQLGVGVNILSGLVTADSTASSVLDNPPQTASFSQPFGPEYAKTFGVEVGPAIADGLLDELELELGLAGISVPIPVSESEVLQAVTSLVGELVGVVVDPLLGALGLQAGIADVSVNDVRAGTPRLVH
ncbi:MAG: pilus assembly protein TadG-related protein [Pseudomonadota bacterium]